MMDMGFNSYCLIAEDSNCEIYRQTDIQYGNVEYFVINKKDAIEDIKAFMRDSRQSIKRRRGTKMTHHVNRFLKNCSEDVRMYYDKYNSVFEYAESMALFQRYYDRVIKIVDKEYIMSILGLCGPDVALAVLCTMFKDKDAIIKKFIKIKQSNRMNIAITVDTSGTEINNDYINIIKDGYTYNKQKLKDLIDAIPDEELKKFFTNSTMESHSINLARKVLLDIVEHKDIMLKAVLCNGHSILGEEKFYEIIEYEKKRIRRKK